MKCPECNSAIAKDDIYCRKCGADLAVSSTGLVPAEKNLPSVLYSLPVPRGVAASVGAVAVGMGLELLRRGLLARLASPSRAIETPFPTISNMKDLMAPQDKKKLPRGVEVQETVIYMRRVIRRGN